MRWEQRRMEVSFDGGQGPKGAVASYIDGFYVDRVFGRFFQYLLRHKTRLMYQDTDSYQKCVGPTLYYLLVSLSGHCQIDVMQNMTWYYQ